MPFTRNRFASAALMIFLTSVCALSQSVETLIGDPEAIASPFMLSGIQFRDDGKTLVGIGDGNTMVAWTLPEGKATAPPEKWRMYDVPMGTSYKVDQDYNVVVTLADGRTWTRPYAGTLETPIGYEEATRRLYCYTRDKKGDLKIFSVLEGDKDRKSVATASVSEFTKVFVALGGQVFKVMTLNRSFTVSDLSGKIIYDGKRFADKRRSDGKADSPNLHVSPDGKRLRIENGSERIIVRMNDGAELLHVNETYLRIADDADNRFIGFLYWSDKNENDLTAYRVKVYFVPDDPGPVKYMWMSGYDGTRVSAANAQRARKKKSAEDSARYEARKKQEIADAGGTNTQSGVARVAELLNNATGLVRNAKSNINQALSLRSSGANDATWCGHFGRALDELYNAERLLNYAESLYPGTYTEQIDRARPMLTQMRRDVRSYGCNL